jgi:hypothetical protein
MPMIYIYFFFHFVSNIIWCVVSVMKLGTWRKKEMLLPHTYAPTQWYLFCTFRKAERENVRISRWKPNLFVVVEVCQHKGYWQGIRKPTEIESRPAPWDVIGSSFRHPSRKSFTYRLDESTILKPVMLMAPYSITSLSHRSSIICRKQNILMNMDSRKKFVTRCTIRDLLHAEKWCKATHVVPGGTRIRWKNKCVKEFKNTRAFFLCVKKRTACCLVD